MSPISSKYPLQSCEKVAEKPAVSVNFRKFWIIECLCFVSLLVRTSCNSCVRMWCCMSDLEKVTIDCEILIGLRAVASMVLGENFLKDGFNVGSCVRRYNLFSFGLSSTTLWFFSDPHWKAISQKLARRYSVLIFLKKSIRFNIFCLQNIRLWKFFSVHVFYQ